MRQQAFSLKGAPAIISRELRAAFIAALIIAIMSCKWQEGSGQWFPGEFRATVAWMFKNSSGADSGQGGVQCLMPFLLLGSGGAIILRTLRETVGACPNKRLADSRFKDY